MTADVEVPGGSAVAAGRTLAARLVRGGGGVNSLVPVARLLDAASDAAWECRAKATAVRAAHRALRSEAGAESAAALAVWRRAVGYDGPDLGAFLVDHYRDCGGIAISLKRAAFIAEQAAAGTSQ